MSYFIELGQSPRERLYLEFAMVDVNTGAPLLGTGIDHQLCVYAWREDYGQTCAFGQVIASNSNGLIYPTSEPGISAISIPPSAFCGTTDPDTGVWSGGIDMCRTSARFDLLAVPADPAFTSTIASGRISFGDRTMSPRVSLKAYPLYPAPLAIPVVYATQVKIQLAKIPWQYDLVEAALPGPTDPATITWNVGGPVTLGGPLSNVIAAALGYDVGAMTIFLTACAANAT